jgi:uncharacterized protein YoxC
MESLLLVIVAVAVVVVAIASTVLPLLLYQRMNEMLQVLREVRNELTRMRKYYEPDLPQATQLMK